MREMNEEEWTRLLKRQEELETAACREGAARFRKKLLEAEQGEQGATVGAAKRLLKEGVVRLEAGLQAVVDGKGGPGRRHLAARWIKMLGTETTAYIALKVVLDRIGKPVDLGWLASRISQQVTLELKYRRFQEQRPQLFEYKLKSFHTSSHAHRAKSLSGSLRLADVDVSDLEMSTGTAVAVGTKLLDLVIETTGLVEIQRVRVEDLPWRRPKLRLVVSPTAETLEWMTRYNDLAELHQQIRIPMVVPPLRWGPGVQGGYRFALRSSQWLVKSWRKEARDLVANADMPEVYNAINTLQHTAWRVNDRVLDVVDAVFQAGGDAAGVPPSVDDPLPAKPVDMEDNEAARKQWRKRAKAVHAANAIRRQKVVIFLQTVSVARQMREDEAFYFPYFLDFRGRVYPVAPRLSPQGNDLCRGLLTFADGKVVDAAGARWLAIHGANCLGDTPEGAKVSAMTFDERQGWVAKHSEAIRAVARDPMGVTWWMDADKPLQFLAFCFEWDGLLTAHERGEEYVCALPCSMDGSCNGLQHFAALLRDPVAAEAVNVTPQERPQDLYQRTASRVLARVEAEAATNPVALQWLALHTRFGIISRKLTKQPTMTFSYGSKKWGFVKQVRTHLQEHAEYLEIREALADVGLTRACSEMAEWIWESLQDIVVSAFNSMAWMQEMASGASRRGRYGRSVRWTVPLTGFPVQQEYYHWTSKKVKTVLQGSLIWPRVPGEPSKVNRRRQVNGISPNLIHSLDAATLILTVNQAATEGVEAFAMIHDSYGTVPTDCELLARVLRRSFVRLYTQGRVLDSLYEELSQQWAKPEKAPRPPELGELEVSEVLASSYFFA